MKVGHKEYIALKENTKHGDFMLPFAEYPAKIPEIYTSFPLHWHDEMEIILVQKGSLEINIDLEIFQAHEGDIVILKPCTLHGFKQLEQYSAVYHTILFQMSILNNNASDACAMKYFTPFLENRYSYPKVITRKYKEVEEIRECLERLICSYKEKDEFFELEIKSQLFHLFHLLFVHIFEKKKIVSTVHSDTVYNVKLILDYISEHYTETITIEELAEILHFSPQYFMRFFKKYTGMTCLDYINDYRLNTAVKLLLETKRAISEIAAEVGLGNVSYFNRLFKRKYEITPREFRKKWSDGEVSRFQVSTF